MIAGAFQKKLMELISSGELKITGGRLYAVGGFVRDELLGRESLDYDIMVTGDLAVEKVAAELKTIFQDQISNPMKLGENYPIWSFEFKEGPFRRLKVDIAQAQKEMFPKAEQRERSVQPGSFADDIQRRDFTINMLARDLATGDIVDESGCGLQDLDLKILRCHPNVNPEKVMSDDPLRMIRAIRFCHTHSLMMDPQLIEILKKNAHRVSILSFERIWMELKKISLYSRLGNALEDFEKLEMLVDTFGHDFQIEYVLQSKSISMGLSTCHASLDLQFPVLISYFSKRVRLGLYERFHVSKQRQGKIEPVLASFESILKSQTLGSLHLRALMRELNSEFLILDRLVRSRCSELRLQLNQWDSFVHSARLLPVFDKPRISTEVLGSQLGLSGVGLGETLRQALEFEDQFISQYGTWPTDKDVLKSLI